MHWAEDLRAGEMRKEQDLSILPTVFSHVLIAQHYPLRIAGTEGGSKSKSEARILGGGAAAPVKPLKAVTTGHELSFPLWV